LIKCNSLFCIIDLSIDVSKIGTDQANELNSTAHGFGMTTNDFYSFLNNDLEEAENIQLARLAEEEKAMFAVRYFIQIYNHYN
jgi:arginine/serine-rich splicing factor 16